MKKFSYFILKSVKFWPLNMSSQVMSQAVTTKCDNFWQFFPQNMANQLFCIGDWLNLVMYPVVVRAVLQDHGLFCPSNWIRAPGGLSDPAPISAPSKKSRSGISWMGWNCPRGQLTWSWSVYIYIFFSAFFSQLDFFP
jgi:hypothetical protein